MNLTEILKLGVPIFIIAVVLATVYLFIKFTKSGGYRVYSIDTKHNPGKTLVSKTYSLAAKPDIVEGTNTKLVVREIKSRANRVYPSDIAQLKATILCVMENYPQQTVVGIVETRGNKVGYRETFYKSNAPQIFSQIENQFNDVINIREGRRPQQPRFSGKCKNCPRNSLCWK